MTDRTLRRDAERNRARLLESASVLFAERGLDVSLDDVARHAGVGVGTAYRRFANKDELINALFDDRVQEVIDLAEASAAMPDAWEGVVHWLEGIAGLHADDRGIKALMVSSRHGQPRFDALRPRLMKILTPMFQRAQADGRLRADVVPADMPLLVFMVTALADYSREVSPDLWRRHLGIVIDGLRAQRRSASELPVGPLGPAELQRVMRSYSGGDSPS